MIGWIKGGKIDSWQNGSRQWILLDCSGVGYEIQILSRQLHESSNCLELTLWIHQIHRDDGHTLFGFLNREERDFFRTLIGVSGIGPQIGISLLEMFKLNDLITAINNQEISKLTLAQGIGKRTAERLSMELRNKLPKAFIKHQDLIKENLGYKNQESSEIKVESEITSTLKSLGYEDVEIKAAIKAVNEQLQKDLAENPYITNDLDIWLTSTLKWLSQEIA